MRQNFLYSVDLRGEIDAMRSFHAVVSFVQEEIRRISGWVGVS